MPQSQGKDSFFVNWADLQNTRVTEAKSNFYPLPVMEIPLYREELRGIDMLRQNAQVLFGDQDASQIFYSGKVFEFTNDSYGLMLKLKVPFTQNEDILVERVSDQVTVKLATDIGHIVNVIPLPAVTMGMKLKKAELVDSELAISFESPS